MRTLIGQNLLRLWLGVSEPVNRRAYALSGFSLMTFKYTFEAGLIWYFAGAILAPWHFVNPMITIRAEMMRPGPDWLIWFLVLWTLPFLWIALTMSVRRAANAGLSPWLGMLVIVPMLNLVFMLVMCLVPPVKGAMPSRTDKPRRGSLQGMGQVKPGVERNAAMFSAAMSIGIGIMVGALMTAVGIYLIGSYGAALFLGTPLLMGAIVGYLYNLNDSRDYLSSMGLGIAVVLFGCVALLLFALEGLICLIMALPIMLPNGMLGAVIGKTIADTTRRPDNGWMAAVALLPLLAVAEAGLVSTTEYEVLTVVEIDASPEQVWEHVIQFPDLPPPSQWYFRAGIAYPQRARIIGEGIGAIRHCEFSTGTFVEPVRVWEPGRRLAFDVTDQPAPMVELSPYRHIHPPHLDGYLRSNRGEFLLIELPDGRTRLEGRTWYEFDMFPQGYWTLWSDAIIHRIHLRVLNHVKQLAEE